MKQAHSTDLVYPQQDDSESTYKEKTKYNKWDIIYSDVKRERYIVLEVLENWLKVQRRSSYNNKFDNVISFKTYELEDNHFKILFSYK